MQVEGHRTTNCWVVVAVVEQPWLARWPPAVRRDGLSISARGKDAPGGRPSFATDWRRSEWRRRTQIERAQARGGRRLSRTSSRAKAHAHAHWQAKPVPRVIPNRHADVYALFWFRTSLTTCTYSVGWTTNRLSGGHIVIIASVGLNNIIQSFHT